MASFRTLCLWACGNDFYYCFVFSTRSLTGNWENIWLTFLVSETFCGSLTLTFTMFMVLKNHKQVYQWLLLRLSLVKERGHRNTRPYIVVGDVGCFFGHSVKWLKIRLLVNHKFIYIVKFHRTFFNAITDHEIDSLIF